MIVPELFHYINYSICFIVGVPLNLLLAWLIVYRSTTQMQEYRSILLLATFTNIVYLTDLLLVMPVIAVKDGLGAFLSLGPLGSMPNPWGFVVIMVWAFLLLFSQSSLAVPFVYRYYVICRRKKWGLRKFVAMLLIPVSVSMEYVYMLYYTGYVNDEQENLAANEHFAFPADNSNKIYEIPFFPATTGLLCVVCTNLMLIAGTNYVLIVIFGRLLYRHLNKIGGPHLSQEQTRALNKQISTTLILQAVIPLVVEFLPTVDLVSNAVSGINMGESSLYMTGAYPWIPVLNPLVTMWVVRAYRREIWGACFKFMTTVPARMATGAASRVAPSAPPQIAIKAIGRGEGDEHDGGAAA